MSGGAEVLDDAAARARLDPGGMLAAVAGLPQQCRDAWAAAADLELPPDYTQIDRIVVLGMGGSAIAGDFLRVLLARESAVPVFNVRQYDLPPYVNERTLVIASSFSGGTEETLSAFDQALATGAKKIAIATGGPLLATARANGVPAFTYRFQGEPRAALGWSLMPLLAIARTLGLMEGVERDVEEAAAVMEALVEQIGEDVPSSRNEAKETARRLYGKLPVIYGAGPLTEVAHRWKTQLNESAKVWAFYEELPEVHHNAIIGYELPPAIAQQTAVVFLRSVDLIHPRVQLRYEFTQAMLAKAGVDVLSVATHGRGALAQMLSSVMLGDYVSCYLALLAGADPTPTTVIDNLKAWLAQQ
ncbi:MAG TPA: bifunctional phosphoglucose/phosphomannose isomerase [Dehalococcoidia bacterium]|nr:bifunctional phosphoglucose/phosphomannose isomerase [Dehalococcoidia bacterium]